MAILGAHMSMAGGYHKAVVRANAVGCDCVQIFLAPPRQFLVGQRVAQSGRLLTKNNNQWRAKPITDDDVTRFRTALVELKIKHPIAHDSYLINLASPDDVLWQKSIEAFIEELRRAELLGIPYVVTHPGASTTSDEATGLRRIIQALDEVHAQTPGITSQCLLENTAGQGSCLGWKFEHLGTIIAGVKAPDRLGVCIDTCHTFAAGYPLGTKTEYQATMSALDKHVGLKRVKAFHLNDSKKELGSRVDRHAHIGEGFLGIEPFRLLLNDSRFRRIPMYLETPKGLVNGEELDAINLTRLRGLIAR
ncbi:MAG TPA: deoxyribonuclease IV [Pirellulales bacterium]